MAKRLQAALPKIVKPAIIEEIRLGTKISKKLPLVIAIFARMLAPAAPAKIPHTSPITSAQIELTLSAFFIKDNACLLPLTLREAIEVNDSSEAVATANPSMSKKMLIEINTNIIIIAIIKLAFVKTISLKIEKDKERTIASSKISTGHSHSF